MGTASWAVPVGSLAGICGAMFIFIWWYFPRAYRKGVQADMDRMDAERREREAYYAAQQQQQSDLEAQAHANADEGPPPQYEEGKDGTSVGTTEGGVSQPAPAVVRPFKYTAPAVTPY